MKYAILALFLVPLTSCSWNEDGPQAVEFGQCASVASLKCWEEVYGSNVTLKEVLELQQMQ